MLLVIGPRQAGANGDLNLPVHLSQVDAGAAAGKASGQQIISTTIQMSAGETVVVGTSPAGGGRKSYVLLLTALTGK